MTFRWWFGFLFVTVLGTTASYLWIDRSLAQFIHAHPLATRARELAAPLTHIPDPLVLIALLLFFVFGFIAARNPGRPDLFRLGASLGVSILVGEQSKHVGKWIFGRPWPETWRMQNPSFIRDGDYRFHWFAGGGVYDSFPSGHMTATCAFLSVIWIYFPGLRVYCGVAGVAAASILVGTNYHFLGDVISGAFLGTTIGWLSCALLHPAVRVGYRGCSNRGGDSS